MERDPSKKNVLSAETLIPAGLIAAVAIPVGLLVFQAGQKFEALSRDITDLSRGISEVRRTVLQDRWTYSMERESWKEFQALNPNIKPPDYKRIRDDNTTEK